MDRAAEALIADLVRADRPEDALFGEEGGRLAGGSGLTWVIDPIDGTVNYLYGLPAYAVSVAVVTGDPRVPGGWQPVAGCVHDAGLRGDLDRRVRRRRLPGRASARSAARPGPVPGADRHRLRLPGPGSAAPRPGCWPSCCPWCATSAGSARPPSTCATWPPGGWTGTTSRGCTCGTSRPVCSWRPRRGPRRPVPGEARRPRTWWSCAREPLLLGVGRRPGSDGSTGIRASVTETHRSLICPFRGASYAWKRKVTRRW